MSKQNSLLGLKIMDVLRENTNINHGLSQQEIVELLEDEYETEVDRKTVGRNLKLLLEYDDERHIGYETVKRMQNGKENPFRTNFYYKSDFEIGEMQVVLDSILSNRHISMKHTKDLIERICGNHKEFKRQRIRSIAFYDTYYKRDIQDLFLNLEKILDAIEDKKDISICVCEYDEKLKLIEGQHLRVSPVRLFMYEQTYYLLAIRDTASVKSDTGLARKIDIFRVEDLKVREMYDGKNKAEEEFRKLSPGTDFAKLLEKFPYMEMTGSKKIEAMTFVVPKSRLKDVVTRFGNRIRVKVVPDSVWWDSPVHKGKMVRVTVQTTRQAMQRFMNEHRTHLYMIEPWQLNRNELEEMKRDAFVRAVVDQALTDEERKKVLQRTPNVYSLLQEEMSRSKTLTPEEKDELGRLVRKMLNMKQDVNKRSYLKDNTKRTTLAARENNKPGKKN